MSPIVKWKDLSGDERRARISGFFNTLARTATLIMAATFFVREVGKKK
jgi:hypothetical protein